MSHKLEQSEVIQAVYDPATGTLKTSGGTAGPGASAVEITDGVDNVTITTVGAKKALDVNVADITLDSANDSVSVPGVSTASNQTSGAQKTQLVDAAGDIVDVVQLNAAPVGTQKGLVTQSIIHGLNSGGGGTYVDVKVNPAGKLLVTADLEQGGVAVGAANPVQVTLANTGANATAVKVDGSAVTQPVSAASLPLPTGAATQTTLAALLTELQLKADLTETQPVSVSGVATAANQSTELTRIGDVTEAAPGTDTASSGLNGRLQRIAQRLTSLIALLPASLGQKTSANSLAVTVASDQSAIPASQSGTWNINNVSGTVSLPTGAATQTTLAALLTELQLKADLSETQPVSLPNYKTIIDEASATVTYVGRAVAGSSAASGVWQISKYETSGAVVTQTTADGNFNFDNIWNNRASLSYS